MILRCLTEQESKDERELRVWLALNIGETDEATLTEWVWSNHHGSGIKYLEALAAIIQQTATRGREYVNGLLEMARKPRARREAEMDLLQWWIPLSNRAIAKVKDCKAEDRAAAAHEEFGGLIELLTAKLHAMFPDKHRATIRGAVAVAFVKAPTGWEFDASRCITACTQEDPLAVNGRASWSH